MIALALDNPGFNSKLLLYSYFTLLFRQLVKFYEDIGLIKLLNM